MLAQNIETFILTSLRFLLPHLQHLVIYMAACAIVCVNELELRGQDETQSATIHKDWDAVFACKKGWTGGDGGGTVDLGNDRVLWMFADSFIGRIENGKHAPGSHMVNKVFAVQSFKDRNRPLQKEFDFALGPEAKNGKPSAWLVPDPKVVKRARYLKENKYPYGWYWPTGGGCLVEVDGKRRLVVFLFHVASNGKQGIWGFENIGCAMAVIDNPERSISEWNVRQLDLPFTRDALWISGSEDSELTELQTNLSLIHI